MGMTIKEKHLKILEEYYRFHHEYDCGYGAMGTDEAAALKDAIDTMRKYKRITQIVKEWEFDHESMVDSMEKISNVIKED